MATHQSPEQKKTMQRVMHEFKHGELKSHARCAQSQSPKQAIAIALDRPAPPKFRKPKENAATLRRTKAKERRGETYQDESEGHRATQESYRHATARTSGGRSRSGGNGKTRTELYAEARRRGVPNRSKMNKAELERALGDH